MFYNSFLSFSNIGHVTSVSEPIKRTLWDKLKRQTRYYFGFAFCSPEDKREAFDARKGEQIARERLNRFRDGRVSLQDRGYAGIAVADRFGWNIISTLRRLAAEAEPIHIWRKREKNIAENLRMQYNEMMKSKVRSDCVKQPTIRANIALFLNEMGVRQLTDIIKLHEMFKPRTPTFPTSLKIIRTYQQKYYNFEAARAALFPEASDKDVQLEAIEASTS